MKTLMAVCAVFCALALPATAADLDVSPLGTYAPLRPIYTWTGCRVGVNIGGGAARTSWVDPFGTLGTAGGGYLGDHTASGVIGGGQLGCDYQVGRFVFGIQGLYDLTGMKASNIEGQPVTFSRTALNTNTGQFVTGSVAVGLINETFIQSSVNITARIGYALQPNVLLYAKAGVARNHNLYNISLPSLTFSSREIIPTPTGGFGPVLTLPPSIIVALGNNSPVGPLVGAGVEWAVFGTDVSLFLEYNYMHFGTKQATLLSVVTPARESRLFPLDITQNVNTVLFGVNYRFFGGSSF